MEKKEYEESRTQWMRATKGSLCVHAQWQFVSIFSMTRRKEISE